MPAPFPPEGVAGAAVDPAESEALNLYRNYAWLARLADEMDAAADLDLKRVMQIVGHARQYRRWYDALAARGVAARDQVEGTFAVKKCTWLSRAAMVADLATIYSAAGTLSDWIETNEAGYKTGYSTNIVLDAAGNLSDTPIVAAKSLDMATQLATFRVLFGPKPA